ncbi:FAD-binding protein [Streptomyces sp. NPDC052052]|uniref:FAD-binding protein n=1 Tax=Streptomyces sp. NPDC052052 TaxID=3154756 RepID=UPI00342D7D6B
MSLGRQVDEVDVVVIGFGVAGAAAALAAATGGARVLVLDRRSALTEHARRSSSGPSACAVLRSAARAAGVTVRGACRAHELVTDVRQVRGVGYAELSARRTTAAAYRCLDRLGDLPMRSAPVFARAADRVWQSDFLVGEVACASVVLALDPGHWDFVGPAMWAAARSARREAGPGPATRRLRVVGPGETAPPTPELSARLWCAQRDAAADQGELRVDDATGAVLVGGEPAVAGLYSAVPTGRPTAAPRGHRAVIAAGVRAGQGAADAAVHPEYGSWSADVLGLTGR